MLKGELRPILTEDAEMIWGWRNQDFVRLNMYYHEKIELESHLTWFETMMTDASCEYFIYEQNQQPLGLVAFTNIDKRNKKAFWAFYAANEKKLGVGVEMEKLALSYAFNELKLHKLCCEVLEFNAAVINFHQRFGFIQEGIRRQDYFRDGNYFDIYELALFRDVYEQSKIEPNRKIKKRYHWNAVLNELSSETLIQNAFTSLSEYINAPYTIKKIDINFFNNQPMNSQSAVSGLFLLKTNFDELTVVRLEFKIGDIEVMSGEIVLLFN